LGKTRGEADGRPTEITYLGEDNMVKGKSNDGAEGTTANPGKISGMEAVRRTVRKLGYDVKTQTVKDHILKEFGQDLTNNKISAYKSTIRRDAGLTRTRGAHSNGASGGSAANSALQVEDIQVVKELVARLGAGRVRELIAVFHS
jgi:hypothetical protein